MAKAKSTNDSVPAPPASNQEYRVTVRNAFVTTDMYIQAESSEAAIEIVKAHLTANVNAAPK